MAQPAARIAQIWRYPVKSMAGERLAQAQLSPAGIRGDRALALLDRATDKVASAKNVRDFPGLMECSARYVAPPAEDAAPAVEIVLPDGAVIDARAGDAARRLSDHFGRDLRLIAQAPDSFMTDQWRPDMPGLDPAGTRAAIVPQPLGASLFRAMGLEPALDPRALQDLFPLSLITSATLAALGAAAPGSDMAPERFRMNILLEAEGEGPSENAWAGRDAALGAAALHIAMPAPRCVMATRPTAGLGEDLGVLRAVVAANRLELPGIGAFPCAGVYALPAGTAAIAAGDALHLRGA